MRLSRELGRGSSGSSFVITTKLQTLPGCRIEPGPEPREFCSANIEVLQTPSYFRRAYFATKYDGKK